MADAGTIRTFVGARLSFDEAAEGLTRLAAGENLGRLVVVP